MIDWKLTFDKEPTEEQIDELIEKRFPSAGYGVSRYSKPQPQPDGKFIVFVQSEESCD